MKKSKVLLICIASSLLAGVFGYLIGINYSDEIRLNKQEKNIVGSYKTTTWNGKDAALIIDGDKTCIHPSKGSNCKWKILEDNIIILSVPGNEYKSTYIELYINEKLNKEDIELIMTFINNNSRVGPDGNRGQYYGVHHTEYNEEKNMIRLDVEQNYQIDDISKNLESLPNIKDFPIAFTIKKIEKYKGGIFDTTEDIEVRIVDKGLMLSGHFFEKLK